jgi:hypothetical protein
MTIDARRIEAEVEKCMEQSLYVELRRVLCNFQHGILTLYGVVSNLRVRQVAQDLIQGIEGIEVIDNQLIVSMPAKQRSPVLLRKTAILNNTSGWGVNSILAEFEF